jgi:hypothetical protein
MEEVGGYAYIEPWAEEILLNRERNETMAATSLSPRTRVGSLMPQDAPYRRLLQ